MAESTTATPTPETPQKQEGPAVSELEKVIEKAAQSAADRVRTEYSNKLKEAQTEIEALRKEKMTAKELAEYEAKKLKDELEQKQRELTDRELKLLATAELEKVGLDVSLMDFAIGTDKDGTIGKIAKLKTVIDALVVKGVDSQLKASARDPMKGREGSAQTSGIEGLSPADIQRMAREDPEKYDKLRPEIMKALAENKFKKK